MKVVFSDDDRKFLLSAYKEMSVKQMASVVKKMQKSIYSFFNTHGIKLASVTHIEPQKKQQPRLPKTNSMDKYEVLQSFTCIRTGYRYFFGEEITEAQYKELAADDKRKCKLIEN